MNVINKLKNYDKDIKDKIVVEKVLISLFTKFYVEATTIEKAKDLESLTVEELMGSLLSHEARIDKNKDST